MCVKAPPEIVSGAVTAWGEDKSVLKKECILKYGDCPDKESEITVAQCWQALSLLSDCVHCCCHPLKSSEFTFFGLSMWIQY